MTDDHEVRRSADRETVATLLHGLADGVANGAVSVGGADGGATVDVPESVDVTVGTGGSGDGLLTVELTSPGDDSATEDAGGDADATQEGIAEPAGGAAARQVSLGRFELFEDRAGEWRWRLVHRNGNVVATSGEGYSRKHNARKGLRSVMRNAEGADVTERPDD